MKYSELQTLEENITIYTKDKVSNREEVLEGINVNSLTNEQLQDPFVVKQLRKQIQSAKKWQTVLGIITKLNVLLSGGMMVGGVKYADYTLNDPKNLEMRARIDRTGIHGFEKASEEAVRNSKLALLLPIIQLSVSVLTTIVKKAIRNKEINDLSALNTQIDKSLSLYEKKLKSVTSEKDKQKLENTISDLKELKEFMDTECDRLNK